VQNSLLTTDISVIITKFTVIHQCLSSSFLGRLVVWTSLLRLEKGEHKWKQYFQSFLGVFAELQNKVTVSFIMSSSVRPAICLSIPLDGFS
jgi:hypothetical protein